MNTNTASAEISASDPPSTIRWYIGKDVAQGRVLYQKNCSGCHRPDASGVQEWRKLDAQGNYPPPPLNGSAHTWHHSLAILQRTIKEGGEQLGGTMPSFGEKLNTREIEEILAWIQSLWPTKVYTMWEKTNSESGDLSSSDIF